MLSSSDMHTQAENVNYNDENHGGSDQFPLFHAYQDPNDELAQEILELTADDQEQYDECAAKPKLQDRELIDNATSENEGSIIIPTVQAVLVTPDDDPHDAQPDQQLVTEDHLADTQLQQEKLDKNQEEKPRQRKRLLTLFSLVLVIAGVAIAIGLVAGSNGKKQTSNVSPTAAPMVTTPTAAPTIGPTALEFKAIETTEELYDMVDLWLNGSYTNDSTWAATYGYPIGQWDVSLITNFSFLFASCNFSICDPNENRNLNSINFNDDISQWNVSNAEDMSNMFELALSFDGDLSQWDVGNVKSMRYMFFNAQSFKGDLSQWNVASVVDMRGMLLGAISFNSNLSPWKVANVMDMLEMFKHAGSFDQNLCDWALILPSNALTADAFNSTACPNTTSPDLLADPKGPFCYNCVF